MEYNFRDIENKWQDIWEQTQSYLIENHIDCPTFYVLDMFPYPSGTGLHVGHPLGYIASDIFSRYKRLKGFHVLHPMGFDSFGLPAEQYAIETGQHPADTTAKNIETFKSQLRKIGFCFDWSREIRTSNPDYYKWTQWIFLQLFNSWYNPTVNKAEPIETLVQELTIHGLKGSNHYPNDFTAVEWNGFSHKKQQEILMQFRLAFSSIGVVNWCEALGTVLANDEVVNGVSERGGHPVIKKKMRQWYLRITDYAERLLEGLKRVDFSDSMKDMQRNWIGRSEGAELIFPILDSEHTIKIFTTRPDTIFGVDFIVVAPESDFVEQITKPDQKEEIAKYITYVKGRSDRDRIAETKQITGCFTGAFVVHPFTGNLIPVWISEYVLAGYGTGAIMAVPSGDQRDFNFANHYNIPITNIFGDAFDGTSACTSKEVTISNSEFLNGLNSKHASEQVLHKLAEKKIGAKKVNYKMHDAGFSRQRYWGEPFPIQWKDGIANALTEDQLPLQLPILEKYGAGPNGEGPLANVSEWTAQQIETSTMPGYAGSSWYFLRYMDPKNETSFCDRKISDYWGPVDVYIGGTEHAVGHLLYSRMWTKALFDLGLIGFDEPFKKLINQGMIQGSSRFAYRIKNTNTFVSFGLKDQYQTDRIHVNVNMVDGNELHTDSFKSWKPDLENADFILEGGKYICGSETEKMSKSKFNTVNPDVLVDRYGADTFRMYEMFLGPIEQSKPWDTKGIEGVHRFIKKLWRMFFDEQKGKIWNDEEPNPAEWKIVHKTIKKIDSDSENFSFNTAVSAFMVCVNELTELDCHKRKALEPVLILLSPFAPHLTEELWQQLENKTSILHASYPVLNEKYLLETDKDYPVSINGKLRTNMILSLDASQSEVEEKVLEDDTIKKWLDGKPAKKIIFVKGKMINVVV